MKPTITDPVCGMEVREDCAFTAEAEGKAYRFCSEGCRARFLERQAAHAGKAAYELIIIGGGPAGLTAAVYAATMLADALVLTRDLGGQAVDSTRIENYMGYDFITGPELIVRFRDQLIHSHHLDHRMTTVEAVEASADGFTVTTAECTRFQARALVVATGMNARRLNVPGEVELQHRGILYGHVSDFSLMAGCRVAVVGGGNTALQMVENLRPFAASITLISRGNLTADAAIVERVLRTPNLKHLEHCQVTGFTGTGALAGVRIRQGAAEPETEIAVDGAFIAVGFDPASALVAHLVQLNERGEIKVGPDCSTSRPGLFAAGDVTDAFGKRIIVASGEGAKAAMAAQRYLQDTSKGRMI
jgi:alkyl hydroperoxide reductase subunit F